MTKIAFLLITAILGAYAFVIFPNRSHENYSYGLNLDQIVYGLVVGVFLGYLTQRTFETRTPVRHLILRSVVVLLSAIVAYGILSFEFNSKLVTVSSPLQRERLADFSRILFIAPATLLAIRLVRDQWGGWIGAKLGLLNDETGQHDSENGSSRANEIGTKNASWIKFAIIAMVFSPLFRVAINFGLANWLASPARSVLLFATIGGQVFLVAFAASFPRLLISRQANFRSRILCAAIYFAWLWFVLLTTIYSGSLTDLSPVVNLFAAYLIGFLIFSLTPRQIVDFRSEPFVNRTGLALSTTLVAMTVYLCFYNPISWAQSKNLTNARLIRKCQWHGDASYQNHLKIKLNNQTPASFFNVGALHKVSGIELQDLQTRVALPAEFLKFFQHFSANNGQLNSEQLSAILSCNHVELSNLEFETGRKVPTKCMSLRLSHLSKSNLNKILDSIDPNARCSVNISDCEFNLATWKRVIELSERLSFFLTINEAAATAAPFDLGKWSSNIELSPADTPIGGEFQRLAIRSNLKLTHFSYQPDAPFWRLLFANREVKRLYAPDKKNRSDHGDSLHRKTFKASANQFGWAYGRVNKDKYYLPLENFSTTIQLAREGNEEILNARALSFRMDWTNLTVNYSPRYDKSGNEGATVLPNLEELYIHRIHYDRSPLDLSVIAPNLKILQYHTHDSLFESYDFGKHPNLEHLILNGKVDSDLISTLTVSQSLKKITVFQASNWRRPGIATIKQILTTALPGVEIEVLPAAQDLLPPEDFIQHLDHMRQRAMEELQIPESNLSEATKE